MHVFDRATALTPLSPADPEPGVPACYGASLDRDLWVADAGPWGGYVAALVVKAIEATVPELPLLSLTVHLVRRLAEGPVSVEVVVDSRGRRVGHVSARVVQAGRTGATALATLGRNAQPDFLTDFEMPVAPPPEDVPRRAESSHPYMQHLDVRPTILVRPWSGDNEGTLAGWIRFVEPRRLDQAQVAALPDGWMPGTWARLTDGAGKVTLDMTMHFRSDLPAEDSGWCFLRVRTRHVERGFNDEECELWGSDGRLLAQSRQLVLLAR